MKLKPSEKRLLIGMGCVLFLFLNYFLWELFNSEQIKVSRSQSKLNAEIDTLRSLQAKVPMARQYEEALAMHLKSYPSLNFRDTYLTKFVADNATKYNLKLSKDVPLPTDAGAEGATVYFIKSGFRAEVSGDYQNVMEFIYALQEPSSFHYVNKLTIGTVPSGKADGEMVVNCNFEIQKWWHPDSEQLLAEAEAISTSNTPAPTSSPEIEQKPAPTVEPTVKSSPASPASPVSSTGPRTSKSK